MPNNNCSKKEQEDRINKARSDAQRAYAHAHQWGNVFCPWVTIPEMKKAGAKAADAQRKKEHNKCGK